MIIKEGYYREERMQIASSITNTAQAMPPLFPSKPRLHNQAWNEIVWQQTLASSVSCTGVGVHSGKSATLTLHPSVPHSGYTFIRTDLSGAARHIPAHWDTVTDTAMCTKVSNHYGASVSTIEHVIAALAGCGIHNATIEVDGEEVPIMDGSSAVFVNLIRQVGLHNQGARVRTVKVLKTVTIVHKSSHAVLKPSPNLKMTMLFNANGRLGEQMSSLTYLPDQDDFEDLLSAARTLGFYEDAAHLWAMGLAQGSSLDNTVVLKDGVVMNEGGLRFSDEFIRHKMLDAVGDLALSGVRILGHFHGVNSGHSLNNQLLRALFADESAWCFVD
jgi:UDP-3-O-[3-hydroxymyristoyl] N-acetylglucosamine deacetylase